MWRSATRVFRIVTPVLAACGVAACAVVGSAPIINEEFAYLGCSSTLGSYSLPKRVLQIKITKTSTDNFHVLHTLQEVTVPDNQHIFCLDHLRSAFASDEIRVFKNKITRASNDAQTTVVTQEATPYLQLIASKAVDHTAGIVRRFIRAAFILLTNRASFAPVRSALRTVEGGAVIVADFQVDPFDYQEMARVNAAIRKFGFCLVLENYTFDRAGASPDRYCGAPVAIAQSRPPRTAEPIRQMRYLVAKPTNGIFFRPRAAYRLSVYVKENPSGSGAWRPGLIKNVEFENIMPVVSVGVDRAVFATRRTGLVFDDGLLKNVCISKGSEAEGFVQIPLEVIYGLVALPSEMIRGAIDDATTARSLAVARKNLIDAQTNYIKFLNGEGSAADLRGGTNAALTLGNSTSTQTFTDDTPPDAGNITGDNALGNICPELLKATIVGGAF